MDNAMEFDADFEALAKRRLQDVRLVCACPLAGVRSSLGADGMPGLARESRIRDLSPIRRVFASSLDSQRHRIVTLVFLAG